MLLPTFKIAAALTVAVLVSAPASHPAPRTIDLVVAATGQQVVGSTYLETDSVTAHGQPFGLDVLTCPGAARPGVHVAHCTIDFGFDGGTLAARIANNNTSGRITGVVTGGTGRYAHTTGHLTGQGTDSGATLTLTLTRH